MSLKPYKLIGTDDPDLVLGEGHFRHFSSLISAANAYINLDYPYQTIVYDDGCIVRELDENEQRLVDNVCEMFGIEADEVEA